MSFTAFPEELLEVLLSCLKKGNHGHHRAKAASQVKLLHFVLNNLMNQECTEYRIHTTGKLLQQQRRKREYNSLW